MNEVERPEAVRSVARQYLRRERPLSGLVVVVAVAVFLGAYLATSLLPAVGVAALLILVARAPILQSHGTFRLRTDDDPETVTEAFTGPTPPVLAFQWAVADEVVAGDGPTTYHTAYLFGLRSVAATLQTRPDTTPAGERRVELDLTMAGRPWATYVATIRSSDDGTIVDVEYTSNRRFGLRRLPQQFVAERYREQLLTVQGYTVVERDSQFGF